MQANLVTSMCGPWQWELGPFLRGSPVNSHELPRSRPRLGLLSTCGARNIWRTDVEILRSWLLYDVRTNCPLLQGREKRDTAAESNPMILFLHPTLFALLLSPQFAMPMPIAPPNIFSSKN